MSSPWGEHFQFTMGTFLGNRPHSTQQAGPQPTGSPAHGASGAGGTRDDASPSLPPQTIQGIQAKCFRTLPDLIGAYQQPNNGLVTPLLYPVHRARQAADEDSGELGRGRRGPCRAVSRGRGPAEQAVLCPQTGRMAEAAGRRRAPFWPVEPWRARGSALPSPAGPTSHSNCTRGCRSRSTAGNAPPCPPRG